MLITLIKCYQRADTRVVIYDIKCAVSHKSQQEPHKVSMRKFLHKNGMLGQRLQENLLQHAPAISFIYFQMLSFLS